MEVKDQNGNINCIGCEDCRNCINCVNCKGCYGCINCTDCNGCSGCVKCERCNLCKSCTDSVDSNNLYYCTLCDTENNLWYVDNSPEEVMESKSLFNGHPFKICKLDVKDIDSAKGIVQFYAGTYEMDSMKDIITKSAYTKTLAENKARIKHFKNHNINLIPGVVTDIMCDTKGLLCSSQLMPSTCGKDTQIEYEFKAITEHSMGYVPVTGKVEYKDGGRIIKEVELWEVSSLTHWGANEDTPMVSLKSRGVAGLQQHVEALHNILHKSSISDERAIILEKELSQIQLHLKSLKPTLFTSEPTKEKSLWSKINN